MKFLLLFMFAAVTLGDQESEDDQDLVAEKLYQIFHTDPMDTLECVQKTEATMEDLRNIGFALSPNNTNITDMKSVREISCAIVCCAQKKGFMVGGVVQEEDVVKGWIKAGLQKNVESKTRNDVHICKEQVLDTSDECMAGFRFMRCLFLLMSK